MPHLDQVQYLVSKGNIRVGALYEYQGFGRMPIYSDQGFVNRIATFDIFSKGHTTYVATNDIVVFLNMRIAPLSELADDYWAWLKLLTSDGHVGWCNWFDNDWKLV